jgi:hypothetical protein
MGDAHIRVAIVSNIGQADLLVHRVASWGLANKPWLWFIAQKQDANVYVHFCSVGMSELKICFVDSYGQAGWANKNVQHPMENRLR